MNELKVNDINQYEKLIKLYQKQKYRDQDPVNIKASELMSNLHKQFEDSG